MKLAERLDRLPLLPFHWKLLVLCGAGWILDAVDTGLVGFVVADLLPRWGMSKTAAGLIISSGMCGLFIGSVLAGWLADRLGRRPLFIATPLLFAAASLLCASAWGPASLAVFRFLLGLALGGEFPVGAALMTEYAPARARGRLMVLLDSFWAYGSVLAALSASFLLPRFGWRATFLINAAPAIAVAISRVSVPESVRYLVLRGKTGAATATVAALERRAGIGAGSQAVDEGIEVLPAPRLIEVLQHGAALNTLRLWVIWFSMTFVYVGLSSWLPAMLVDAGFELSRSFRLVLLITLAQIPGYLTAALVVERWGRRWSLGVFTLGAGVCSLLFARAAGVGGILWWGSWMAYFNMAAWGVLFAYTAEQFATRRRATGTGSCIAMGRFGGMVTPLATAALLEDPAAGRTAALGLFGLLLLVACLGAWLGRETGGQSLETLHAP